MSDSASKHLKCLYDNLITHISQLVDDNYILLTSDNPELESILTEIREAWEDGSVQEALEYCEEL